MISRQTFRTGTDKIIFGFIYLFSALALIPFLILVLDLLKKGIRQINFDFFTRASPSPSDAILSQMGSEIIPGGILNGIYGSFYIVVIAILLAVFPGVMTGIYLFENRKNRFSRLVQDANAILYGMPAIIIALFVYLTVVNTFHGFSAFAGAVALAITLFPMITRATKESLKQLPGYLKESGLALGGSYTGVMLKIIMPAAWKLWLSGLLMAVARTLGKTTPLILTALGSTMVNWDISKPTATVTLLIWKFFNNPNMVDMMWSASLFLFVSVISLVMIAKHIARQWETQIFYG
ncbi:MAG: ABC transporter permease subunit [Candidatus Symbiothrix sp.]|nr:ABC transporter permease subunit [Candidatus Symbiothrix sp.]